MGGTTMIDRAQSVTSDDLLSSFFGKGGSMGTLNMHKIGSETDFAELLKKMPSVSNLSALDTTNAAPAMAPIQTNNNNNNKSNMQRVASLDVIRAYLNKRAASASPDGDNKLGVNIKNEDEEDLGEACTAAITAVFNDGKPQQQPLGNTVTTLPPIAMLNPLSGIPFTQDVTAAMKGPAAAAVDPSMLPYLAAMNAAAMMNINVPTTVAMVAMPDLQLGGNNAPNNNNNNNSRGGGGGGGVAGGSDGGYSSGDRVGPVTAAALKRDHSRGTSADNSGGEGEADLNLQGLSRRERRMLSNRESARRSRKRKQEHLAELEAQMSVFLAEKAEMEATIAGLKAENEALKAGFLAATASAGVGAGARGTKRSRQANYDNSDTE